MRARVLALMLALLVLTPLLAGCADDAEGPRLGQPTSRPNLPPVTPPTPVSTPEPTLYDPNDPGVPDPIRWQVGDGWDYESNASVREYRTLRVVGTVVENDRTLLRVEERFGRVGGSASAVVDLFVDPEGTLLVRSADTLGTRVSFDPPMPLRFYRNGSYEYTQSGVVARSGTTFSEKHGVGSFLEAERETLRFPWGNVAAFALVVDRFKNDRFVETQWIWAHPDYANHVRYTTEGVGWTLKAASVNGKTYGVLQP